MLVRRSKGSGRDPDSVKPQRAPILLPWRETEASTLTHSVTGWSTWQVQNRRNIREARKIPKELREPSLPPIHDRISSTARD